MVGGRCPNTAPSGTTQYVYDLAGHLLAESDGNGNTLTEYVWLDDMPLAVVANVNTGPNLYFVHVDHLNRPIMMTDVNKTLVWRADYNPFGDTYSIGGLATNNLRFPGQYFLIEDGLHYNWYRHYDPTIGRYIQPDPIREVTATVPKAGELQNINSSMPPKSNAREIGAELPEFTDGASIYAYVQSAPEMKTDRRGLASGLYTPIPSSKVCNVIPVCVSVVSLPTECVYWCEGLGINILLHRGVVWVIFTRFRSTVCC